MLRTRLPLAPKCSYDLHALDTPPAFILSQDQTLIKEYEALCSYATRLRSVANRCDKFPICIGTQSYRFVLFVTLIVNLLFFLLFGDKRKNRGIQLSREPFFSIYAGMNLLDATVLSFGLGFKVFFANFLFLFTALL